MAEGGEPIRAAGEGVEIAALVVPRASRSRVVGVHGGRLKVQIAAPPVDGAANAELEATLAEALDVPRRAVAIVGGQTSKRKTVRVAGIDLGRARSLLGLSSLAAWVHGLAMVTLLAGCQPITTEVELKVLLPADASDLNATNNVTVVLHPDGFSHTIPTVGTNFALDAELEPDDEVRQLSVYLARNDNLLAWGTTPGFTYGAAGRGAAVFVARPGRLSTFPLSFSLEDPDALAAHAFGHGLVVLGSDGSVTFLDGLTLSISRGATLLASGRLPEPGDGAFVGDALGGAQRVAWNEGIRAHRFDPADDTWVERSLAGAGAVGSRTGAAHLVDTRGETLLLYGGGTHADVVAVSLLPSGGGPAVARLEGLELDAPRRGANAMALVREQAGLDTAVLFGSDDPAMGVVRLVERGQTLGPEGLWLGGRCTQLDRGGPEATLRVLCAGGMRDDEPTADGVLLIVPGISSADPLSAQLLPDLLEAPMRDPLWLEDSDAVYAQGDGRLVRLERASLAVSEVETAPRWSGGSCVRLPTGATFLVGGVSEDDTPVSTWEVFVPTP
jgi:uncharacterized protein (TIGR00251 family)